MRRVFFSAFCLVSSLTLLLVFVLHQPTHQPISGAPPYGEPEEEAPEPQNFYSRFRNWKRPEGPAKVALQVGHWKNTEVPEELRNLKNNTGSSGGGKWEWEVNYEIANLTKSLLEKEGIAVELLPTTVPAEYWADVFIAIHADGSEDLSKSGFKIASPWRDLTNKASDLVQTIEYYYQASTGLTIDPNITRNMRGYYAFSWWRYNHTIHPMTTAAILETGFLTNRSDQKILINSPADPAQGLATGIKNYLQTQELIP